MSAAAAILAGLAIGKAPARAALIVDIQPVSICLDDGSNCSSIAFDASALQTFWLTEAGLTLNILPSRSFNSTTYQSMADLNEVLDLLFLSPSPDPLAPNSISTSPITFWFAVGAGTAPTVGLAAIGGNRGWIQAAQSAIDQTRVLAHELGHTLGLEHGFFGPNNLMESASLVGSALSTYTLNDFQAGIAQASGFVREGELVTVPAPAGLGLFLLGLVVMTRRRMG